MHGTLPSDRCIANTAGQVRRSGVRRDASGRRSSFATRNRHFGRNEEWNSETEYRLRSGNGGGGGGDGQAAATSIDPQRNGTGTATGQEEDDDVLSSFNSLAADGIRNEEAKLEAEEDDWCAGGLKRTFAC